VSAIEVPDTSVGLLIVDGEFTRVLEPGLHAFWKFQRALKSEFVDRRVQAMEVQGQEILTRDKVSLRVNLTALWQVLDAVKARSAVSQIVDTVYKELQFALRAAVGARTLDELLGDKGALDREIGATVAPRLLGLGLAVSSVGVKDVILPGEMKTIEENRTLLRLKELETLEKVTEKIDKLTVYGGLEGVLKDVVRIAQPEA
jgi:regulator of protease activity HflC (stomatin/prohibitin superfamily)